MARTVKRHHDDSTREHIDLLASSNSLGTSNRFGSSSSLEVEMTSLTGIRASAEEMQTLMGLGETAPYDMLLSRRMARYFSARFPWYGRNADLDQAWAYYEMITLPRRMENEDGRYGKAPTGAENTSLYPAWTTTGRDLVDFGTGVAVYFETMRVLIVIMLVAGLLYTPTFMYYKSDAYGNKDQYISFLRGSMMCTDTAWAPCPDCTTDEWKESPHRIAFAGSLTYVLKNICAPLRWQEGVNHLIVVVFLIIAIIALASHQEKMELQFDEEVLTASDYSIAVSNPPLNANDPDEWKVFFSQFGDEVVYVTVALHNEELVNLLATRRKLLQNLGFKIKGRDDVPLQFVPKEIADKHPSKYKKLMDIERKCRQLMETRFDVSEVFVTFETESAQRKVLQLLTVGKMHVASNNRRALISEYLFRGNFVLDVIESVEPSAIRWQDLDETFLVKALQRVFTFAVTVGIIYGGFQSVCYGFEQGTSVAAYEIAILNIVVPKFFIILNRLESHRTEGSYQASLYVKICAFRWINTAVITTVVKPFLATLEGSKESLIVTVYTILKAEIVIVPIVHMLDIMGNIKRHLLAPTAKNQAAMNSFFSGAPGLLGEKYTGITKIVFLCFFYSMIFPSSFFFGAAALTLTYLTEKFNLLRSWAPMPELGNDVARLSRRVFFPLAVLALAVMSDFYWSAYPFDNVCHTDETISDGAFEEYAGTHRIVTASNTTMEVTVNEGSKVYRFCNQDFLERLSALFDFFREDKRNWMSKTQIWLSYTFLILCGMLIISMFYYTYRSVILPYIEQAIGKEYRTDEIDSGKKFSERSRINAYVPQIRTRDFPHPLLACDISEMDPQHISWMDPIRGHDYYNILADVEYLLKGRERQGPVLSIIRKYSEKKAD